MVAAACFLEAWTTAIQQIERVHKMNKQHGTKIDTFESTNLPAKRPTMRGGAPELQAPSPVCSASSEPKSRAGCAVEEQDQNGILTFFPLSVDADFIFFFMAAAADAAAPAEAPAAAGVPKLRVAIAGGGIGGMALALALRDTPGTSEDG